MLSGEEIIKQIEKGNILIKPFNKDQINPNSYNLTLSDELTIYTENELDFKKINETKKIKIPEEGYVLEPNKLYLAKTNEYTETYNLTPHIDGRSSIGRVGLTAHVCSGFGEIGYKGQWTLGITCIKPVKVYSGMEIAQIYFYNIIGDSSIVWKEK